MNVKEAIKHNITYEYDTWNSHHVVAYFAMCLLLTWFKQAFNSTQIYLKNKICAHELQEAKGTQKQAFYTSLFKVYKEKRTQAQFVVFL